MRITNQGASKGDRVFVQQPAIPHYRISFFDQLQRLLGGRLLVMASESDGAGTDSARVTRSFFDLDHRNVRLFGGVLLWQCGLGLSKDVRPGDVVVVSANPRYISSCVLALVARVRGAGLVFWGHGWSPTSRSWRAWLRRRMWEVGDCVLVYTDDEAREIAPHLRPGIRIVGAQNAIDQAPIKAAIGKWPRERLLRHHEEQGLIGRKIVVFSGRLRTKPATDLHVLLEAMTILVKGDSSYLAVVIGDGADRSRLERFVLENGLEGHVRWLGKVLEEDDIAPWFLSAGCFVYPGSIGLSILHAMGYGLPVITHADRKEQNPEIAALRPGVNGYVFPRGDAHALADRIKAVFADACVQAEMSREAVRTVESEFTLEAMADRFVQAVEAARMSSLKRVDLDHDSGQR